MIINHKMTFKKIAGIKRITKIIVMLVISICFVACGNTTEGENLIEEMSFFPIRTYKVYEVFNENSYNNSFDQILLENSIDKKMESDLQNVDISSTRSSQIFFNEYVKIWMDELEFSIENLEKYLTEQDITKLEETQKEWEKSVQMNSEMDRIILSYNEVGLGTQYVSSNLIYLIDQYRDRVFHIKYMTMLSEVYVDDPVLENERTWSKFHID